MKLPLLLLCLLPFVAAAQPLVPPEWDPALAGDVVMERLINTSSPRVKGVHDAEFVCVGDRAYLATEANDRRKGVGKGS